MNIRSGLVVSLVAVGLVVLVADTGCSGADPFCGPGQVACGNGCMDEGRVCCGDSGNCPGGTTCGPNGTCLSGGGSNGVVNSAEAACQACVASGQICCANYDLTVDCAPAYLNPTCCGNHTFCAHGAACLANGQCS